VRVCVAFLFSPFFAFCILLRLLLMMYRWIGDMFLFQFAEKVEEKGKKRADIRILPGILFHL
jgi:hypothetical protein